MQLLCTLRNHCRQGPRNTRYQADATPYLGRTFTGWIAPACGWRTYSITSSARRAAVAERQTERLRGLEVDDQLELGALIDRQIGGLLALENPAGIDARLDDRRPQGWFRSSSGRRLRQIHGLA